MSKKLKPNLVSVYEFASLKGVTNVAVYYAIKKGYIIPTMLGKHKNIDLNVYSDYQFPFAANFKTTTNEQETVPLE